MGDRIENLPTDDLPPTQDERDMVGWLFGDPSQQVKEVGQKIKTEFQSYLYVVLLFVLLNLPPLEELIKTMVPLASQSWIVLLVIKAVLFLFLYFLFVNSRFLAA